MTSAVPADLAGFVARTLDVSAGLVTPQSRFADLGRDSLAEVELLNLIEDHYRITLDFEKYLSLETVGDLAEAIASHTSVRTAG
jgi:acyl carrier protein